MGEEQAKPKQALNKELVKHLETALDWSSYQTEYDGRMYSICHSCGGQDGEHTSDCELPAMRAAIDAAMGDE